MCSSNSNEATQLPHRTFGCHALSCINIFYAQNTCSTRSSSPAGPWVKGVTHLVCIAEGSCQLVDMLLCVIYSLALRQQLSSELSSCVPKLLVVLHTNAKSFQCYRPSAASQSQQLMHALLSCQTKYAGSLYYSLLKLVTPKRRDSAFPPGHAPHLPAPSPAF
jgi:hypothetical protein